MKRMRLMPLILAIALAACNLTGPGPGTHSGPDEETPQQTPQAAETQAPAPTPEEIATATPAPEIYEIRNDRIFWDAETGKTHISGEVKALEDLAASPTAYLCAWITIRPQEPLAVEFNCDHDPIYPVPQSWIPFTIPFPTFTPSSYGGSCTVDSSGEIDRGCAWPVYLTVIQ